MSTSTPALTLASAIAVNTVWRYGTPVMKDRLQAKLAARQQGPSTTGSSPA